jgi:DNA-binding transcriptional regulator LsrR (DeoR family)
MPGRRISGDRMELLADVVEMYYEQEMTQEQIARRIGVTRSMISHMLHTAKQLGIVEIRINRPLQFDHELEAELIGRFGLQTASVLITQTDDYRHLIQRIGVAAARLLKSHLTAGGILGLSWGMTISAMVKAFDTHEPVPVKVVQIVGAVGARGQDYDGMVLVRRMARLLGGEAYYLNAPFVVDSPQTARALLGLPTIRETIELGAKSDLAVFGIGTTALPEYSSLCLSGHITPAQLERLRLGGAVGDVCGHYFDVNGSPCGLDFSARTVAISHSDLLAVPLRMAVAVGSMKVPAILGALRAGYINILVIDAQTAEAVLVLDQETQRLTAS